MGYFTRGHGRCVFDQRFPLRSRSLPFHRTIFHPWRFYFPRLWPRPRAAWTSRVELDRSRNNHRSDRLHLDSRTVSRPISERIQRGVRRNAMNVTLLKALVALVPVCMLFSGSVVLFSDRKTMCTLLQLLGAGCLVVVVLTHTCEALHLFPWMHWGAGGSVGHYLDFWSAVFGLFLFPVGYLFDAFTHRA